VATISSRIGGRHTDPRAARSHLGIGFWIWHGCAVSGFLGFSLGNYVWWPPRFGSSGVRLRVSVSFRGNLEGIKARDRRVDATGSTRSTAIEAEPGAIVGGSGDTGSGDTTPNYRRGLRMESANPAPEQRTSLRRCSSFKKPARSRVSRGQRASPGRRDGPQYGTLPLEARSPGSSETVREPASRPRTNP